MCAIKSQVIPQLISLSIHAVASLNKSLTYQCLRNLERFVVESHRKLDLAQSHYNRTNATWFLVQRVCLCDGLVGKVS